MSLRLNLLPADKSSNCLLRRRRIEKQISDILKFQASSKANLNFSLKSFSHLEIESTAKACLEKCKND